MTEQRKLNRKNLVKYLANHNSATIPQIANDLDVDPTTVGHHLDVLIEKGIVSEKRKSYGSRYMLNPALTQVPKSLVIHLSIALTMILMGMLTFMRGDFNLCLFCLLVSASLGIISVYRNIIYYKSRRLREILGTL